MTEELGKGRSRYKAVIIISTKIGILRGCGYVLMSWGSKKELLETIFREVCKALFAKSTILSLRKKLIIVFPFFHYFTGWLGYFAYLLAITSFNTIKIKKQILFLLLLLSMLLTYHIGMAGKDALYPIRFFWGWLIFYLFFLHTDFDNALFKHLVRLLSVYTILEAIAVNTVIDAVSLPNYPSDKIAAYSHFVTDGYQRPYSFGASATVTATILLSLLIHLSPSILDYLLIAIALFISASGTGYLLYFFSFFYQCYIWIKKGDLFFICLIFAVIIMLLWVIESYMTGLDKRSIDYLYVIAELKQNQITSSLENLTGFELFLGKMSDRDAFGGDFAMLSFFNNFGLMGLLILSVFILFCVRKSTFMPVIILLLGTIHYGVIFFLPGQLLFGYLLASNESSGVMKKQGF